MSMPTVLCLLKTGLKWSSQPEPLILEELRCVSLVPFAGGSVWWCECGSHQDKYIKNSNREMDLNIKAIQCNSSRRESSNSLRDGLK